ncbi:MAG: stage III sporulation protein AF [Clostridiaceae bacterium]|nr:stage III sporulation protein AF [Clostridiaceae bacterium]
MIGFIKSWTVNIVVLVLFIVITEMLLPRGKVRKYANLVTGTILVIAIIEPVTGLFGRAFDFSFSQAATAGAIDKKEIEKAGRMLEQEHVKQTIRLYRSRMIEQIEQQAMEVEGVEAAKADVIVNEDRNSTGFGEIKRVYIEVEWEPDGPGDPGTLKSSRTTDGAGAAGGERDDLVSIRSIREVEPIRIGGPDNMTGRNAPDPELKERLETRISDVFGVDRQNIVITQVAR